MFHGCEQTLEDIGLEFVKFSGYIELADTNNLKILYPQSIKSIVNPKGCFDWWGYSGSNYASNLGIQPKTIINIIKNFI